MSPGRTAEVSPNHSACGAICRAAQFCETLPPFSGANVHVLQAPRLLQSRKATRNSLHTGLQLEPHPIAPVPVTISGIDRGFRTCPGGIWQVCPSLFVVLLLQGSFEQTGAEGRGRDTVLFGDRFSNDRINRGILVDCNRRRGGGGVRLLPSHVDRINRGILVDCNRRRGGGGVRLLPSHVDRINRGILVDCNRRRGGGGVRLLPSHVDRINRGILVDCNRRRGGGGVRLLPSHVDRINRGILVDCNRRRGGGGVRLLPSHVGFQHKGDDGRTRFRIRNRRWLLGGSLVFRAWSRLVEVRPVRHINRGRDGVRIRLLDQIWRSAFRLDRSLGGF